MLAYGSLKGPKGTEWYFEIQERITDYSHEHSQEVIDIASDLVHDIAYKYDMSDLATRPNNTTWPNWFMDEDGWPIILDWT